MRGVAKDVAEKDIRSFIALCLGYNNSVYLSQCHDLLIYIRARVTTEPASQLPLRRVLVYAVAFGGLFSFQLN